MAHYSIGFDIGTTLGYCVIEVGETLTIVDSGVLVAKQKHKGARLNSMYQQVWALLNEYYQAGNTVSIAVEEVAFTKFRLAYASYCQMRAMVELAAFTLSSRLEIEAVHTSTLKKHATGNGKASKDEMLEAAQAQFSFNVVKGKAQFDQADAIWVAHWAHNKTTANEERDKHEKTSTSITSKPKRLRSNTRQ